MNCPNCGSEADADATFCPNCGTQLANAQTPTDEAAANAATTTPPTDPRGKFQQAARAVQQDDELEEQDVWDGSYSPKAMIGWWVAAAAVTVVAMVAGLIYLKGGNFTWLLLGLVVAWALLVASYFYRRFGVHYYLTTQRFLHETGILWRRTDRIELIDIDDVTFHQGPIGRMFNVGTIHLSSSDKTDPEMDLPGIESVREVADKIDDLRRKERRRRGLHIEAV